MIRGKDGAEVSNDVAGHLEYLSELARHLGVPDPVEEYFAPVVGRWSDLHAEADRWRLVGAAAEEVTDALTRPLGKLDAAWDGAAAESFIQYMQRVGLAGNDLSDAMIAMADVLDRLADGVREIVRQLAEVLAETAEASSEAMTLPVQGDSRAREYLDLMRRPAKELFESVRQVLEAFVRTCEGVDGSRAFAGVVMPHTFPEDNWTFQSAAPKTPDAPKVDGTASAQSSEPAKTGGSGSGSGQGAGPRGGGGASGAPAPSPGGHTAATEQPPQRPATPPAAAAASSGTPGRGGGGMGMPMGMMPMGGAAGQGGDTEHKSRTRVVGDATEIFGKPPKASAPVIGVDDD